MFSSSYIIKHIHFKDQYRILNTWEFYDLINPVYFYPFLPKKVKVIHTLNPQKSCPPQRLFSIDEMKLKPSKLRSPLRFFFPISAFRFFHTPEEARGR